MPKPRYEKMRRLFPQCVVTDDEISWEPMRSPGGAYISGYRGQSLVIDGDVTPEELAALVEWHNSHDCGHPPEAAMTRFTQNDWSALLTAVNMIAAGEWDEASYGERPDWEALINKIQLRIKIDKAALRKRMR